MSYTSQVVASLNLVEGHAILIDASNPTAPIFSVDEDQLTITGGGGGESITTQTLISGSNVEWDIAEGNFAFLNLEENTILSISNPSIGTGILKVTYNGFTLSIPPNTPVGWTNVTEGYSMIGYIYDGISFSWSKEDYSEEVIPEQLAIPGSFTATAISDTQINLTWTNVANEVNYQIERSLNGINGWSVINSPVANAVSYSNIGLTAETQYFYRIKAVADNITFLDSEYASANATTEAAVTGTPPTSTFSATDWNTVTHVVRVYWNEEITSSTAGWTLYVNDISVPFNVSIQAGVITAIIPNTPTVDGDTMRAEYNAEIGDVQDLEGTNAVVNITTPNFNIIMNEVDIVSANVSDANHIRLVFERGLHVASDRKTGFTFKKNGINMTLTADPINVSEGVDKLIYTFVETILSGDILTVSYDNTIGTAYDFEPFQNKIASFTDFPVTNTL